MSKRPASIPSPPRRRHRRASSPHLSMRQEMASSIPDWSLLDPFVFQKDEYGTFPDEDPTEARSKNSRGDEIRVCVRIQKPPQPSSIFLRWPNGGEERHLFAVVAAHRDAVLFQNSYPVGVPCRELPFTLHEYFIYRPGGCGGGSRPSPPSLLLLPSIEGNLDEVRARFASGQYEFEFSYQRLRRLSCLDMAVLCRDGEKDDKGEFVVVELEVDISVPPVLHILHSVRSSQWEHGSPQVTFHGNSGMDLEKLQRWWAADAVVPAGSGLIWVDYCLSGLLYCNVFDGMDKGTFELHYVPLPAKLPGLDRSLSYPLLHHTVSFSEDDSIVKFVMISDAKGEMVCQRFGQAVDFNVSSWTLNISATWVDWKIDAVVTSDELWKLECFERLPHVTLEYPLVSMVDPNILYFVLREEGSLEAEVEYNRTWLVAIDTYNKSLESVFTYLDREKDTLSIEEGRFIEDKYWFFAPFLPIELPKYMKQILSRQES